MLKNPTFLNHLLASTNILCICISETYAIYPLHDDLLMNFSSNMLHFKITTLNDRFYQFIIQNPKHKLRISMDLFCPFSFWDCVRMWKWITDTYLVNSLFYYEISCSRIFEWFNCSSSCYLMSPTIQEVESKDPVSCIEVYKT